MTMIHNSFHIITGGPGAGKTTLIEALAARGFRTVIQGVSMTRDDLVGYDTPGAFVLDDWR